MAVAKVLYGALFLLVLPAALIGWAHTLDTVVALKVPFPPAAGLAFAGAGAALMIAAMADLWRYGGGLPMNAFPPPRYVSRGVYGWLAHPIYTGFCALALGVAIAGRSAAGFWLVTPVLMLACAALVFGYERPDLLARFGRLESPRLALPPDDVAAPSVWHRVSCYAFVLLPWAVLCEAIRGLGLPPDARSGMLGFEAHLPVLEWAELIHASAYAVTCLVPLLAATRRALRRFAVRGLLAQAIAFPMFLAIPLITPPRPFTPHGPLGRLLVFEGSLGTPAEAFPSLHVIWALLAAEAMPRRKWLWRAWATAVAVSCVATGMHSLADVLGGAALGFLLVHSGAVWEALRRGAERVANSWHEWRWGSVRIINHGFWGGAGAGLAVWMAACLSGSVTGTLVTAAASLVAAALWAQLIEGSPRLLRPFGFYGGVAGAVLGALLTPDPWLILAAVSVAGPWVQSLGRMRCLVQGCCHGRPAPKEVGIHYRHPRSRVCRLTTWRGLPLHPTPLYSILWNVVVAVATVRLWSLHAPLGFIAGLYLALTGLGRFVEEAYRGEPQTPIVAGLRLYQWIAVATILIGAVLTTLARAAAPSPQVRWAAVAPAVLFAVTTAGALGVDFPESNRRFARLA